MKIIDVNANEYEQIVGNEIYTYCRRDFLELNKDKVDKVHYLIGRDTKDRLALAIGEKDNEWKAPYSAPFVDVILLKDDITVENIYEFISGVNNYAKENGAKSINIYLPADAYDFKSNALLYNALLENGYKCCLMILIILLI